jgi:Arc/MetJ-type ribon-helix-helix transcriptional regulator
LSDSYVVARVPQEFRELLKEHVARGGVYMSLSDFARAALREKFERERDAKTRPTQAEKQARKVIA